MIEDLIRSAAKDYYASISREQFINDLRRAGFTVYEAEQEAQVKGCYISFETSLSRTEYPMKSVLTNEVNETIKLPDWTYRIPQSLIGSGEYLFGDAA